MKQGWEPRDSFPTNAGWQRMRLDCKHRSVFTVEWRCPTFTPLRRGGGFGPGAVGRRNAATGAFQGPWQRLSGVQVPSPTVFSGCSAPAGFRAAQFQERLNCTP